MKKCIRLVGSEVRTQPRDSQCSKRKGQPSQSVCCTFEKEPQGESRLDMPQPAWKGLNRSWGGSEKLDFVQLAAGSHEQVLSGRGPWSVLSDQIHGEVHTSFCPLEVQGLPHVLPPSKKGQELGWAGLAVVTLVFSCLQRDLGRREQRAEGGLASHSEYSVSWTLTWSFKTHGNPKWCNSPPPLS